MIYSSCPCVDLAHTHIHTHTHTHTHTNLHNAGKRGREKERECVLGMILHNGGFVSHVTLIT